jgi:1,4-alpha-glucan branching enzyme
MAALSRERGTIVLASELLGDPMIRLSRTATNVKVTFALPHDQPIGACSVVGDFNGWQPGEHPMRRRSNGTRSVVVTLPRGTRLRFRYLGANGHWFNDSDVMEFDGSDCVLVV